MKKILYVTTSTGLGGAEKTLSLIASSLPKAEFEVAGVVSLKPIGFYGERLRAAGMRVDVLGMDRVPRPSDLARLREIIEETRPDVVHAFLYTAIQLSRLAKRLSSHKFKLVTSPRAIFRFRGPVLRQLDRLMKGADDMLISECEASRQYLLKSMGYSPERVVTVLNGLEPDACRPKEGDRPRVRGALGLKDSDFLVGTVGRIDPQKDPEALIAAVVSLLPAHPGLRAILIGDGPLQTRLGEGLMRSGLSDKIWLVGVKPETREWFSAMDLFVLPSRFEGLPNVLLEAMAAGLPVIATAVDGTVEVVEDKKTGCLVAPGRPAELAKAIKTLMEDAPLRARLAKAGQEEVERRFTLGRMIAEYADVYRHL